MSVSLELFSQDGLMCAMSVCRRALPSGDNGDNDARDDVDHEWREDMHHFDHSIELLKAARVADNAPDAVISVHVVQ